jgi:hypothetical protein
VGVTYVPKNILVIRDSGLLIGETTPGAVLPALAAVEFAGAVFVVGVAALEVEVDVFERAVVFDLLQPAAKSKIADNIKINFFMHVYPCSKYTANPDITLQKKQAHDYRLRQSVRFEVYAMQTAEWLCH